MHLRGYHLHFVCTHSGVWYKKEIMMNDDNLESNLLTSSLLKKMSGLHAGTS